MTFNIEEATVQEAVDYSVQQIVKQGGQCLMIGQGTIQCMYGDGKGRHCAVGWLLDHDNEGLMGAVCGVAMIIIPDDHIVSRNKSIFRDLQCFHDVTSITSRRTSIGNLEHLGIDTSGKWFQQWVDMAEGE